MLTRLAPILLASTLAAIGVLGTIDGINSYYLYMLNLMLINAIAAIGLVILSGVAGLLSLGTAALLAIGAYGTSMLIVHLGMGFLPAAVISSILAMLLGAALAAPALRLGGLHLAIVTLAFGVIVVQLIGKGGALTGGMNGLMVPEINFAGFLIDSEPKKFWIIAAVFLVVVMTATNFVRRKPGRALLVLREREITARALGINTSLYKTIAFAYSSLLAGIAGALYALLKGYVSVDDFSVTQSIYYFVMIVVGGMSSIVGGIIGAAFVTVLPEALSNFKEAADAIFGVIMLLVIFVLPGGLVSLRKLFWNAMVTLNRRREASIR